MSDVFKNPPPAFSNDYVFDIIKKHFDISPSLTPLVSDRDQNFKITEGEKSHIFKIANSAESRSVLEMQNSALSYISKKDDSIEIPQPVKTIDGHDILSIESKNTKYHARLLTYVDGVFLKDVKPTNGTTFSVGKFLGYLDKGLVGFDHRAAKREFIWDVSQVSLLESNLTKDDFDLITFFINSFKHDISSLMNDFPKTIIHNDGNDHNILVDSWNRVKGIIDFGDMIHSFRVIEPSVAMAYIAIEDNNFELIASLIKGYRSIVPLSMDELKAAIYFMCLRMCVSITMSAKRKILFPENKYISTSEENARKFLIKMREQDIQNMSHELVDYVRS